MKIYRVKGLPFARFENKTFAYYAANGDKSRIVEIEKENIDRELNDSIDNNLTNK